MSDSFSPHASPPLQNMSWEPPSLRDSQDISCSLKSSKDRDQNNFPKSDAHQPVPSPRPSPKGRGLGVRSKWGTYSGSDPWRHATRPPPGRVAQKQRSYLPFNINFVVSSPPFWRYNKGTERSTPSTRSGRAAQGAMDRTFAKSIQY